MVLFDHYPAAPAAIDGVARRAGGASREATTLVGELRGQAGLAGGAVSGVLAGPMAQAPVPVCRAGTQVSAAAAHLQRCMRQWAGDVATYNAGIDDINARHAADRAAILGGVDVSAGTQAASAGEKEQALTSRSAAALAEKARLDDWLEDRAAASAAMLDDPTSFDSLAEYWQRLVGGHDEFWQEFGSALRRRALPPEDASTSEFWPWLGRFLAVWTQAGADLFLFTRLGWLAPAVKGNRHLLDPVSLALRSMKRANWVALPDHEGKFARWKSVSRYAKGSAIAFVAVASALQQWEEDSDRPDLAHGTKVARAGAAGAISAVGVWGGGLVGSRLGMGGGAWVGAHIGGMPGAVILGGVGFLGGGALGGALGLAGAEVAKNTLMPDRNTMPPPPPPAVSDPPPIWVSPGEPLPSEQAPPPPVAPYLVPRSEQPPTAPSPGWMPPTVPGPSSEFPLLPPEPAPPVEVEAGDSLWQIAEEELLPPDATEAQVQERVEELYEANRDLIGDDPDLIHPDTPLNTPQK